MAGQNRFLHGTMHIRTEGAMKILIADDHYLIVKAMGDLLADDLGPDVTIVAAATAQETLERLSDDVNLAVLDLAMPGTTGVSIVEQVRARWPELPIVVISGLEDPELVKAAIAAGASGYLLKARSPEAMRLAVRVVLGGDIYVPSMTPRADAALLPAGRAVTSLAQLSGRLTDRQMDVVRLLPQELTNKEIGQRLAIDSNTVKAHLAAIFRALGVNTRGAAIAAVRGLGAE
jgi:DNA-binding NarL/FixJ family response regulator